MSLLKEFIDGHSFLQLTRRETQPCPQECYEDDKYQYKLYTNGILSITPSNYQGQRSLALSCAIHGNETAPIEIVEDLLSQIRDRRIRLTIPTLFIFGNPKAINNSTRFIDFNLNRLFNSHYKNIDECHETHRAHEIEQAMDDFFKANSALEKLHYDLHTAIKPSVHEKFAIVPFSPTRTTPNQQLAFLEDLGLDAIVFSSTKANTFSDHSYSNYGAYSMTVELGKVHPFGQNPTQSFEKAKQTLTNLLTGHYQFKDRALTHTKCYKIVENIMRENDSFKFHFSKDIENFEEFKKNEPIWSQNDETITAFEDGLCILFPNDKVKFGQRAGLLIKEQ